MKRLLNFTKILSFLGFLFFFQSGKSQCVASFSYAYGANGNVTFTSTSIPSNSLTTIYYWTFGNGIPTYSNTGTAGMFPTYTYTANGNYTVTLLIVSSSPSCSNQVTAFLTVTNVACPLQANFTVTQGGNGLVNFGNTSTGTISGVSYLWNFGNGATSTSMSPSYNYTLNGTYIVTLTANNNSSLSCVNSKTASIVVNSICSLVAGFTYTTGPNGLVQYINSTTPTTSVTYTWSLGNSLFSSSVNPAVTYTANGNYTVILLASSSLPSCSSSITTVITITNVSSCSLSANFSPIQMGNGSVNFTNTSTGTFSSTTYPWNFGNGQNSNLTNPLVTYTANGNYLVTLFASNNSTPACTSTKTLTVLVSNVCNLLAGFTYSVGANGLVNFSNTTTGSSSLTTYLWNFGHSSAGNSFSSTATNPSHSYPNGSYVVVLSASSSTNCANTYSLLISVITNSCPLVAGFTHTQVGSGQVNFSNASAGTNSNTIYTWNFGDGWSSASASPSHVYTNGGTHYVTLHILDSTNAFCHSTDTQAVNITGLSCLANSNFSLVPTATAQYWNAIPVYPYNVIHAQWTWGDGSNSTGLYTSHQYSAAGLYSICLSVTVSCGSSATSCSSYSVYKSSGAASIIYVNVLSPNLRNEVVGLNTNSNEVLGFNIYPNPSNGYVSMDLPTQSNAMDIRVSNLLGETVFEQHFENTLEKTTQPLDLTNLPEGIYFISLSNGREISSKKLVLTKN